jgi:hypothetical protein
MEVATRRVHLAGCTTTLDEAWMKQIARNLTGSGDGFLLGTRYLPMDRDAKFCSNSRSILKSTGADAVRCPGSAVRYRNTGAGWRMGGVYTWIGGVYAGGMYIPGICMGTARICWLIPGNKGAGCWIPGNAKLLWL